MDRFLLVLLIAGAATAAPRPFIDEYAPTVIKVASGERYLGIVGGNFTSGAVGPVVRFSGPAGNFELIPNSSWGFEPHVRIQVWVPEAIVQTIGRYSAVVHNDVNGDSDPVYFEVNGDSRIIITAPPYITMEAAGPSGAVVTYAASAESTVGAPVAFSCAPASGSTFPLGRTDVVCTGTTEDGASSSMHFGVTVYDHTPPSLTVPADIVVEATDDEGAVVHFEASATDTVDTGVPVQCSPASGSRFPIRTTEVRCSATDDSFNSTIRGFTVTVTDHASPRLMLPADITAVATSYGGAEVTFTATAMDYAERTIPARCTPESGSLFPLGTTVVTCTVIDDRDRRATGTFRVTVNAPQYALPVLVVPEEVVVQATSANGAVVTFTATATDYAQRSIPVTCAPPSGSLFPFGSTAGTCSATDDRNQTVSRNFVVHVVPADAPTLVLPNDITVEAATPDGTSVAFMATAYDSVDGELPVSCAPMSGATFPLGATTVTCSAANTRGGTATGTFQVRVVDTVAPVIGSITASPDQLWPVNKRLVDVEVSVTASDDGDAAPHARITGVLVSEGVKPSDWRIVDDLTVALRADRNGKEKPRIYTIVVEVSDASGNIATGTVDVTVPHEGAENGTVPPQRRRRASGH
jgi:hypothetical protein